MICGNTDFTLQKGVKNQGNEENIMMEIRDYSKKISNFAELKLVFNIDIE